jgi:hypothetical protein
MATIDPPEETPATPGRAASAPEAASGAPPARSLVDIDEAGCRALLERSTVGRLAISTDEGPQIFTVNYGVHDGAIVIWTGPGLKLAHASFHPVAFEVDELDAEHRTGWVVEAIGHAEDITDAIDPRSTELRHVAVDPWVTGSHPNCIAIARPRLSGRRLVPVPSS